MLQWVGVGGSQEWDRPHVLILCSSQGQGLIPSRHLAQGLPDSTVSHPPCWTLEMEGRRGQAPRASATVVKETGRGWDGGGLTEDLLISTVNIFSSGLTSDYPRLNNWLGKFLDI